MPIAPTNSSRQWDILGVGDIDVDLYLGVTALPGPDEKVLGAFLGEHPGGMIANVCCAASQLGSLTAMMGAVGDDVYGRIAVEGLAACSVDTSLVRVRKGGRTFFCVIMLDGSGEKALTAVDTDCHLPVREDVDLDALGRARVVHLMGDDLEFATWTAMEARRRDTLVSLDLEPSTAAHGASALGPLLANTDIVFMNEAGCVSAFGEDIHGAAFSVLGLGPSVCVVTRGARGVFAVDRTSAVVVPALRVPVADTTGAGDCFIGAFLTRLLAGWDITQAARFATAAAALSIGGIGSRTALPTTDKVMAVMGRTAAHPQESGAK